MLWVRRMAMLRVLFTLCTLIAAASFARAAEPVDLLLVLASDVSRSVDQPKFQLQRDGYAAALNDRRVIEAIQSGANRRIALCFVEWSGAGAQKIVIDWTLIDGAEAARKFSDALVEAPRSFADRTSISGAIDFSMEQLERAPFESKRRTIDVSGDGTHNAGRGLLAAREDALAQGVTINGLVILSERPLPWNPGAHQSARRPCEILSGQRHRRSGRLRDGRGKLPVLRPGPDLEADRRDRGGAQRCDHQPRRRTLRQLAAARPASAFSTLQFAKHQTLQSTRS